MNPAQIECLDSHVILRLTGDVTIADARELHTGLMASLAPGRTLRVDASALTRIDAAVLQMLLAAGRAAGKIELAAGSAAWAAALERFAVNPLDLPARHSPTP